MNLQHNRLSAGVATVLSMGAVAAMGFAGAAHAQDQATAQASNKKQPQTLQTVVVTGSHIRAVDLADASPVITVSAQQIQQTGKLTLGAVIKDLPAVTGGNLTPVVNNTNAAGAQPSGQTLLGLRGMGPSRTLTLVNGQRILNTDLNAIPAVAVERIEVLTDGASSVYGSDAIGGVINIILKSNYQGAQFSMNYGTSDHGDGTRRGGSFMFGQSSDKGSLLAGVSYNKFDEVLQGARKFSQDALSLTSSGPNSPPFVVVGGSGATPRGSITLTSREIAAKFGCSVAEGVSPRLTLTQSAYESGVSPVAPGDFKCFNNQTDKYNYATVQALMEPQERTNAFINGVYHLSNNVDAYLTAYTARTSAEIQLAPGIFGSSQSTPISVQSFYNPFEGVFAGPGTNGMDFRSIPGGNRFNESSQLTFQGMFGLRGHTTLFSHDWTWDVGMDYGYFSYSTTVNGLPNATLLVAGLGPSFKNAQGVVQCGTPASPIALDTCTPWDPFDTNSPSAKAALAAASTPSLVQNWEIERTYHVDVSGGIFDLPAGTAQLALGASFRKRYQNNTVPNILLTNQVTGSCAMGSQCNTRLQGGFNDKEIYAELFLPILKDLPLAKSLSVDLGDRYSKYSTVGSTSNWKAQVEYRPIADLLLRGTVSKVFRAPSISQIFGLPTGSTSSLSSDPCDHITVANPACVGVPLNGTFENSTVANHGQGGGLFTGAAFLNFPIKPEQGKSFDFGAVYSPHYVPGLTLSADFWRIYLNNTLTTAGEQTVLDMCFDGVSQYCPLITRNGPSAGAQAGQITNVYLPATNLGRVDVKGIDLSGGYRLPDFSFGQITLSLQATYLQAFKQQIAPGFPNANQVLNGVGMMGSTGSALQSACPFNESGVCFFPRVRGQFAVNWQLGPWSASWRMRGTGPFQVGSADLSQDATALQGRAGYVLKYGSYIYNDLTAGYTIEPLNTSITFGVDNVFDKQPPMLYANNSLNANTDPADFDVMGRYYWGRVTVKF